jgi:hypothetical protein
LSGALSASVFAPSNSAATGPGAARPIAAFVSPGYRFALLAIVLGLVLGAGAVGLTWFMTARSAAEARWAGDNALSDARAACTALGRVPDLGSFAAPAEGSSGANSMFYQLSGAAYLAQAAGTMDANYQPLSDALRNADQVIKQNYPANPALVSAALVSARAACASH